MDQGADIVAVCITCCTITGLVFGVAGIVFGRTWAIRWARPYDSYDQDNNGDTTCNEPGIALDLGKPKSVRHRVTSTTPHSGPSFL